MAFLHLNQLVGGHTVRIELKKQATLPQLLKYQGFWHHWPGAGPVHSGGAGQSFATVPGWLVVQTVREVNDATILAESLNDKLKQGKTELVEVLKETPVKDLRKAIGINDRFLFINELFRGDEAMYERSIKTINSFNIYPEAKYWISRELKIKVGWSNDNPTVKHFDHLVKRRFS